MLKKQRTTSTNIGFETRKRLRQTKDSLCKATCLPAPSLKSKQGFRVKRTVVQLITWQVRKQYVASNQLYPPTKANAPLVSNCIGIPGTKVLMKMKQNKTSELLGKWLLHLSPLWCSPILTALRLSFGTFCASL